MSKKGRKGCESSTESSTVLHNSYIRCNPTINMHKLKINKSKTKIHSIKGGPCTVILAYKE